ncbi:alpha/beta hydrolase [Belliella marina]|uniref:Alpha/beta hydrolase n=1 Tax=Belliella marina TaxID=1644146 RepID=A0ABW4VMS8_9BACT
MKLKNSFKFLIVAVVASSGFVLSLMFFSSYSQAQHVGISEDRATVLRDNYSGLHHLIHTSDGETLFLRRWNPDLVNSERKEVAILILHGFTAHSGAYDMVGIPFSESGYTTFGLDYRGHGLSGGNRGDTPGKKRWISDLAEAVVFIKELGYSEVVVLGHSLGVAASFTVANAVPYEIAGLVLLSGAYEGRDGLSKPPSFLDKVRFVASAIFRPSHQSVDYYREGMTVLQDSLFTMKYTPRFLMMLDVRTLRLPDDMNIPVLVGIGDNDELFTVEKVKELYDLIPGNKKEFLVMENTTHSIIPRESWMQVVDWLDRSFVISEVN